MMGRDRKKYCDVQDLFESMEIQFAFPTQTVHLKAENIPSFRIPELDEESSSK